VLKRELAIPLIATAFIACASATTFIALADPAKRTTWTWAVCALAIALILALNVYWFGIRPRNQRAAFALLERSGFIRTATDDPTLNETLSALCATPFPPKQVISACVLDAGRSRTHVVHGCTVSSSKPHTQASSRRFTCFSLRKAGALPRSPSSARSGCRGYSTSPTGSQRLCATRSRQIAVGWNRRR
jgi:hypothetical protein